MKEKEEYRFFIKEGAEKAEIKVWHYGQLSAEEKEALRISQNCYYVQVLTGNAIEEVELFTDEHDAWKAKPDILNDSYVAAIGKQIESLSM